MVIVDDDDDDGDGDDDDDDDDGWSILHRKHRGSHGPLM